MFSLNDTWDEFLKIIKEEAGSQVVETWFKAVTFEKYDVSSQTAHLRMPNQFVRNWVKEHYCELLKTHLRRLLNADSINLHFTSEQTPITTERTIIPASALKNDDAIVHGSQPMPPNPSSSLPIKRPQAQPARSKKRYHATLNDAYIFDSFIIGPSNSLAHAAAYAVSQNLANVYNPLFIYGGTGLGKTHLLHAIGNEAKRINPKTVVRYETADRFMHDFIHSIRFDKSHQFRDRYQKTDLLLIDDVQFFSNKEQTQEMFFHIFNTLYELKKQIVLSSDTFPREIKGLQSRLKSRLGWGLVVDIQVPNLETKMAILKKKADQHNINLDDEVATFIASRVISNIRELEGSLVRVGAFASLTNKQVTVDLAKKVLLHLPEENKSGVMLNSVFTAVAKHYAVSAQDLRSKKRHKNIASVRQVAFYMMKKLTFCSLQVIGAHVGGRDHSTVIHAISKVEKLKKNDPGFAQKLKDLEQEIRSA